MTLVVASAFGCQPTERRGVDSGPYPGDTDTGGPSRDVDASSDSRDADIGDTSPTDADNDAGDTTSADADAGETAGFTVEAELSAGHDWARGDGFLLIGEFTPPADPKMTGGKWTVQFGPLRSRASD
jgi:hypothetical protein